MHQVIVPWALPQQTANLAGMTPAREVRPMVGLSPMQEQWEAGPRVLSPVSVPSAATPKPAATAAALPPLEPAPRGTLSDTCCTMCCR